MATNDIGAQLMANVQAFLKTTGAELAMDAKGFAAEMQASSQRLQKAIGQPGYDRAFADERRQLAILGGIDTTDQADTTDGRMLGFVEGAIGILAAAL